MLDEARASLRRLQVQDERILRHSELNAVGKGLLLTLERHRVIHHDFLQVVHVPLLVLCELLDEALEGISRLSLR